MKTKHRKTLEAIFARPTQANIRWHDVEALFVALGSTVKMGAAGSRVNVKLNNARATFHKPHPGKEINKPTVRSVRNFLKSAGVKS